MFFPPVWDDALTHGTLRRMHANVLARRADSTSTVLNQFVKQADALFVLTCNILEDTIPKGLPDSYYRLAEDVIASSSNASTCEWDAEGMIGCPIERKSQIIFSSFAFRYLIHLPLDKPLTSEHLIEAHRLLMSKSVDTLSNTPTLAGAYRTHAAHNGAGTQYADAACISSMVDKTMRTFAEESAVRETQISAIARAVHSLLLIHPFQNGNGRLCHMLAGVMVKRLSLAPFAVPLSSCRSRSRKHFFRALQYADRNGNVGHLSTILLNAIDLKWGNYERLEALA